MGRELEGLLVGLGLYQDEAHAMIETWRTSWFEEGSRLFYLAPAEFVNRVLPLSIKPEPAQTVRVFVGRLENVTPPMEETVERALATHDSATLERYGRFPEPILQALMRKESNPTKFRYLQGTLSSFYSFEAAKNQHRE